MGGLVGPVSPKPDQAVQGLAPLIEEDVQHPKEVLARRRLSHYKRRAVRVSNQAKPK